MSRVLGNGHALVLRGARRSNVSGLSECAQHDQQLGGASPLWRLMAPTTSQWQLLLREEGGKEAGDEAATLGTHGTPSLRRRATVPPHPANQTDGASGTPAETSPGKTSNLHRAPTASTQRPLDRHRASPCRAGSPGPPRLIRAAHRRRSDGVPCVPRVAASSPASFPPSSRSSSCH